MRILLTAALILLVACSDNSNNTPPLWTNDPLVETASGPVQGLASTPESWSWKAIPFAAPPVGELRFRAPEDPSPWTEPLSSEEIGAQCTQYDFGSGELSGQEDCLTLNVWRPQTEAEKLPVYVWIHGGGNTSGSAAGSETDGANLAITSNVIYVSLQYRLGPLGWWRDPALRNGDADTDSGNFGTLDLIKGLQWIQDNIEQFGGDPERVIITGESAGGINVISMLLSPLASGLYSQAMSQSGLTPDITLLDGQRFSNEIKPRILVAEGLAADAAAAQAMLDGMHPDTLYDILANAEPASIMDAVPKIGIGLLAMPFVFPDGHVIVDNGRQAFAEGNYPGKVPLIIGTNSGDVRLFLFFLEGQTSADPEFYNAMADIGGQLWKAAGADELARDMAQHSDQPPVYVYSFEWGRYQADGGITPAPWNYTIGAAHSLDIPFFLDTLDQPAGVSALAFSEENRNSRDLLGAAMVGYLQQFIANDDPNGDDLPIWSPWSSDTAQTGSLILNATLDELAIRMQSGLVTRESALANLELIADPVLRSEVKDFLHTFVITCSIIAEVPSEC